MYIKYNNDRFQWVMNPRGEYILIDTLLCQVVAGSTLPNTGMMEDYTLYNSPTTEKCAEDDTITSTQNPVDL